MDQTFVEVRIENISLSKLGFIVFLRRQDGEYVLPICIGAAEAQSIAAAYNNQSFPRPLSHDLFKSVLETLECTLEKVQVTELRDGTFYARIFLNNGGGTLDVDSRPSDAIALALRFGVPIWVNSSIIEQAGISVNGSIGEAATGGEVEADTPVPDSLSAALAKAIREERYEDAARIRDRISEEEARH
ncbi:MAG TPA: hypothetical protein DCR55_00470 [Lentisphaeria bacterium]|nr:hypothetical protein [Lentisphaeria bacterium]